MIYEHPRAIPDDAFRFLLDEPHVNGVAWQDDAGWHGCLDWGQMCTDYIGPYANRSAVTTELRGLYVFNYRETTD